MLLYYYTLMNTSLVWRFATRVINVQWIIMTTFKALFIALFQQIINAELPTEVSGGFLISQILLFCQKISLLADQEELQTTK